MVDYRKHLINNKDSVRQALAKFNLLAADAILFLIDDNDILLGSLTDGDIRRGFISGLHFDSSIILFTEPNPVFISKSADNIKDIIDYRKKNIKIIPVLDETNKIIDVLNLRTSFSMLPIDAVVMAGGEGRRLRPLTEKTPKPLLMIGAKPIIEYNIDRLIRFGVKDIHISINYLGEQIIDFFNAANKPINIHYLKEETQLGTIGSISLVEKFNNEAVLVMNSDLLTNINIEDFYLEFLNTDADMAIATIPYNVNVPYAVLETANDMVISFKEKPTYTYYSNAGIYFMKKDVMKYIPRGGFFNATDLMETLINDKKKVISYPLLTYWLDIGKHDDFLKAQEDIKHLNFDSI